MSPFSFKFFTDFMIDFLIFLIFFGEKLLKWDQKLEILLYEYAKITIPYHPIFLRNVFKMETHNSYHSK